MEDMCNLRRQWPASLLTGMSRQQTNLESQRRECKNRFRNSQAGRCTYCGQTLSNYHLDLAQLWRCPVYSVERNFPRLHRPYPLVTPCGCYGQNRHSGEVVPTLDCNASSVNTVVKSNVSCISTDVVLLGEHGAQLVHHHRVFGDCVAHDLLYGSVMIDRSYFTNRACIVARWAAKRSHDSGAGSGSSPDRPGRSHSGASRRNLKSSFHGTGDVPSVVKSAASVPTGVDVAAATAVSPLGMPHWILHHRSRSRSGRAHRRPSPGRRPLSLIWPSLIWSVLALLCPVPRCLMLCRWPRWICYQRRVGLCHPAPRLYQHLRRWWIGGLSNHRSHRSSVQICQLLQAGSRHSNPPVLPVYMEDVEQVVVESPTSYVPQ